MTSAQPAWSAPVSGGPTTATKQDEPAEETPEERRERLRQRAEERRAEQTAQREERRLEAEKLYDEMAAAYLSNRLDEIPARYRAIRAPMRLLSREQQQAIRHMNEKVPEYRPDWWRGTKRQEKNSFEAEIWGREFWANYVPTDELGLQAVFPETRFNTRTGEVEIVGLTILVTWKPLMVDSPDPAKGRLSREHGYTLGDIAEIIVWHELGHNYITEQLPLRANIELYENYSALYSTLHEYYADMTALYHCTPRARKIVLQFRLDGLDYYKADQEHCRASHGIGAIILADMLANPDAWPSVRFPPSVPERQVEVNTLIYVYENLGTDWTLQEDIRLQEIAKEYIMKQGESTFKRKGQITLPNRLKYNMMVTDDREQQVERDEWVAAKLAQLIESGRADTVAAVGEYDPPERDWSRRHERIVIRFDDDDENNDNEPKRIEVPWDF